MHRLRTLTEARPIDGQHTDGQLTSLVANPKTHPIRPRATVRSLVVRPTQTVIQDNSPRNRPIILWGNYYKKDSILYLEYKPKEGRE